MRLISSLSAIKNFFSFKKALFISLSFLAFILGALFLKNKNAPTNTPSPSPLIIQPETSSLFTPLNSSLFTSESDLPSYYINRLDSLKPVTHYSWLNQTIIYSTPDGIYSAPDNQPLLKSPINYLTFSHQGSAIYQSDNGWFLFKPSTDPQPLTFSGTQPQLSPDGQLLASLQGSSANLLNLNTLTNQTISLNFTPSTIIWSSDSAFVGLNGTDQFSIFSIDGQPLVNQPLSQFETLQAIAPKAQYFATAAPATLSIYQPNSDQKLSLDFTNQSDIKAFYLNSDLLVIATAAPDFLDRRLSYLYYINGGQKIFITDDTSIPDRLKLNTDFIANADTQILPLIENNGPLWILSLKPNQFPNLSSQGFSFLSLPNYDHH